MCLIRVWWKMVLVWWWILGILWFLLLVMLVLNCCWIVWLNRLLFWFLMSVCVKFCCKFFVWCFLCVWLWCFIGCWRKLFWKVLLWLSWKNCGNVIRLLLVNSLILIWLLLRLCLLSVVWWVCGILRMCWWCRWWGSWWSGCWSSYKYYYFVIWLSSNCLVCVLKLFRSIN